MDKQKLDLARRVMAAPGFRPLPGMRIVNRFEGYPVRMIADGCFAHEGETGGNIPAATDLVKTDVPDLDDPATVGCLLALVRKRFKLPNMTTALSGRVWYWMNEGSHNPLWQHRADSEVELMTLALEKEQ